MIMKMTRYKLSEISLNITDGEHGTVKDAINGNYYLLSCKNIKNGIINIKDNERTISKKSYNKIQKRIKLEYEDILITTVGTIGEMAIIKDNNINYCFQRSVGIIKPNKELVDPYYLYYAIKNEMHQISTLVKGAVQKCLFINDMKQIELNIPRLDVQYKVSKILSNIDKKVELNNEISNNLYKYISSYLNSLYEDELVPISRFGKVQGGYAFKSKDLKDETTNNRIIKIKNLRNEISADVCNSQFVADEIIERLDKKFQLHSGDVAIAMTGAELGKTGFIYGKDKYFLNQRVGLIKGKSEITEMYLRILMLSSEFQILLNSKGYGSAQPNISTSDIENIEINNISEENLNIFYKMAKPIYEKIVLTCEENLILEQLRDTLLPKLMNGEIDLDKIEK